MNKLNAQELSKLNAQELFDFLCYVKVNVENYGAKLEDVEINYRYNDDSDVRDVAFVEEDLFDEKNNNIIESIILKTN